MDKPNKGDLVWKIKVKHKGTKRAVRCFMPRNDYELYNAMREPDAEVMFIQKPATGLDLNVFGHLTFTSRYGAWSKARNVLFDVQREYGYIKDVKGI